MRLTNLKTHKILLALLIILLIVGGYFVYEKVAYELNKRAFAQAKSAIDTVYADFVRQVGQPDDNRQIQQCSSSKGSKACSLTIDFIYPASNKQNSVSLRGQIQKIVGENTGQLKPVTGPQANSSSLFPPVNSSSSTVNFFKARGGLYCLVDYIYDPTFNTELALKQQGKQVLFVDMNCFGHSRGIYYSIFP